MKIDTRTPSVSVVMPIYNAAKYLELAIQSILLQTERDFELLLLDDGSTDRSAKILHEYSYRDARCKVHSRENRGIVYTLNEGVSLARSGLIVRMDADDISYPTRIEKQLNHFRNSPTCVAVGSSVQLIDPKGNFLTVFEPPEFHNEIDAQHMKGVGSLICHPSVAIRKDVLLSVGGYRREFQYAEDFDLFLRLAEKGQIGNIPEVLIEYRQHLESVGYSKSQLQLSSKKRALDEARTRRGLSTASDDFSMQDSVHSAGDVYRKWAWWALQSGHIDTARMHAFNAIRASPFSVRNLPLMLCVLRGH